MKLRKSMIAMTAAMTMACSLFAGCGKEETTNAGKTPSTEQENTEKNDSAASAEKGEETIKVGDKTLKMYVAGFQNLDSQIWSWGTHVDRMGIFEGLTILNPDFTTRMGNAESVEHNEDYTVWTAKLREDLKWSDGTPLTANDYYFSLERVIDPQYLAGKSTAFNTDAPILNAYECQIGEASFDQVGIKVLDDYTIEFTLDTVCVDFDVRLAESWALPVPKHAIEKFGDDWTKPENIVVNGPYIPTAREEDVHLTLEPNKEYYEATSLEKIDLYTGTQNQLLAYQNGDVNVATITAADIDAVLGDETLKSQMKKFDTSVLSFIGLLKGKNDVLQQNPMIRQAISKSIDRETIATSVAKDTLVPANSFIFPKFADWTKEMDVIEYDVEEAKRLMEEAGYPNGEGLGTMTVLVAGTPGAETLAVVDMIQRGTGIQCEIVNMEWAAFVQNREAFHEDDTFGIYIDAWNTSVANAGGSFAKSQFEPREGNLDAAGQKAFVDANQVMKEENAARKKCKDEKANHYFEVYEKMLKERDPEALEADYKELEQIRLEDASNIPLYFTRSVLLVQPSIEGYEGNPLLLNSPPFYFKDVSNN